MKLNWLMQGVLVGAGGFLGSILRYAVSGAVHRAMPTTTFPYGTFVVNTVGCLAIGFLAGMAETRQLIGPEMRLFLFIGLLGGFTTFSTFGYESFALLRDGEHLRVAAYVGGHILVAFAAVWAGRSLSLVF
jgi:CrcB protein